MGGLKDRLLPAALGRNCPNCLFYGHVEGICTASSQVFTETRRIRLHTDLYGPKRPEGFASSVYRESIPILSRREFVAPAGAALAIEVATIAHVAEDCDSAESYPP
jgi:hypothetical protein